MWSVSRDVLCVKIFSAHSSRILLSSPALSAVLSPGSTCCVLLTTVCLSLPLCVCVHVKSVTGNAQYMRFVADGCVCQHEWIER